MSIHDQAQQLAALADRVPTGQLQSLQTELTSILQQATSILGDTSSANTVQAAISQAQTLISDVGAVLEHARTEITNAAHHHLRG
ncbi:hypothetical protein SAMN05216174_111201 [Actinokineospora iranica]|uniref:Uncharacterized protein n=2 Tax=Actinokineospora iranica TaxID=1271860 RepID=A0A1G6V3I3_9PSEU|nr:hypothetical protein SAMN05216174_111201 [Actinokineospora iranica]